MPVTGYAHDYVLCVCGIIAVSVRDETSPSVCQVVTPVNDEAIAMAALSTMADSISSSEHFAPDSEHTYAEQTRSQQLT